MRRIIWAFSVSAPEHSGPGIADDFQRNWQKSGEQGAGDEKENIFLKAGWFFFFIACPRFPFSKQ